MQFIFALIMFMVSRLMMSLKKDTAKPQDPAGWDRQTIQREGVSQELGYGRMPVTGNAICAWTDVVNVLQGPEDADPILVQIIYFLRWGVWIDVDDIAVVKSSRQRLHTRLAFGDGPIVGLVAGESTVNGRPLTDYQYLVSTERLGTDRQTATGMGDRFEIPQEIHVAIGTPVTVTMPDRDYSNLAIIVGSPEGLLAYSESGGTVHERLGAKIEIREVGGAWQTLVETNLLGAIGTPARWIFYADQAYDGGTPFTVTVGIQHEWRVSCSFVPTFSPTCQGKLYVIGVQEIYDSAYRFPGIAYLQLEALSTDELTGNLDFRGLADLKLIEDCAGALIEWTDNPARVIRDLICRPVISGDGGAVPFFVEYYRGDDPANINQAEFLAAEAWCDLQKADGRGATEKQFRFDDIFTSPAERYENVMAAGKMCRLVPWFDGHRWRVYIETTAVPTHIFCDVNMRPDSYREESLDVRAMPGAMQSEIFNAAAGYDSQQIKVVDHLATTDRVLTIDGFGTTHPSQFTRLAKFFFDRAKNLDLNNEWRTGAWGKDAEKGTVAYVQSNRNGRQVGGIIVAVVDDRTVRVDRPLTLVAGTTYYMPIQTIDPDGKHVVKYEVSLLPDAYTVRMTEDFDYTPVAGDIFIYGATLDAFRIVGVQASADGDWTFSGERYTEDYYARDDEAPEIDTSIYLASARAKKASFAAVTRQELLRNWPQELMAGGDATDQPNAAGLTFTGDGVGTVTWTVGGLSDLAWIRYNGTNYPIQADAVGTTDRYIYFDPGAADPTTLKHTSDVNLLRGLNRFIGCENMMGVAYPRNWYRMAQEGTALLAPVSTTAFTELSGEQNGMTFHNAAASGAIYLCLPAAIPGLEYEFRKDSANAIYVVPSAGEGFLGQAVDDYLELDAVGDLVKIACSEAGTWRIIRLVGSVTYASGGGSVWLYDEAGHILLDEAGLTIEVE